jgi:hypothetical protein
MGFNGDCGDIQSQFSGVQGPYVYGNPPEEHMYLDDYVCTAFPDDAYVTDQMLVGLISVAVALPVDLFLARAFEIANEGDAPESWVEAPAGKWKWVVGKNGHNDWRLADPKKPISDLVLWLIRYSSEPIYASVFRLIGWLRRKLREKLYGPEPEEEEQDEDGAGTTASAEARAEALTKRLYASLGLLGVYLCWTIFSWFIFTYGAWALAMLRSPLSLTVLLRSRNAHLQDAGRQGAAAVCKGAHHKHAERFGSQPLTRTPAHRHGASATAWTTPPSGKKFSRRQQRPRSFWSSWTCCA